MDESVGSESLTGPRPEHQDNQHQSVSSVLNVHLVTKAEIMLASPANLVFSEEQFGLLLKGVIDQLHPTNTSRTTSVDWHDSSIGTNYTIISNLRQF